MLARLGRLTYRARWIIVLAWAALFAVSLAFAPRVTGVLRGGGYTIGKSESITAYNTLHDAYGYRALTFNIVFAEGHAGADAGGRRVLLAAARAFRRAAELRFGSTLDIRPPVWTPDHQVMFERIYSAPQPDFGAGYAGTLQTLLPRGSIRGYLAGPAAIYRDMEVASDDDVRQIEIITLPIALVVLLFIFRSVVASTLPVLMAPVSVTLALACIYFLGHQIDMSIFVLNTTSMLGLGVAIDYSLFMVNRFREELARGSPIEAAVADTVATSGRAILVSALVVSVGFFGLTLSGISMLTSLGIGGTIVTVLSLLVALTLLPAILGILGDRVNMLPVLPARLSSGQLWRVLALYVMRAPIAVIGVVAVIVVILALPAFHLRVGVPGPEILPPSLGSRAGNDILNARLGDANQSPVLIVVKRLPHTSPATSRSAAFAVLDRVCASSGVIGVSTMPVPDSPRQILSCQATLNQLVNATPVQIARANRLAAGRRVGLVAAFLRANPSSVESERYVAALRDLRPIPGYQVYVGGQTAAQMDFNHYLYSHFPWVILFVTGTIFVVLLLAFGSLLLPLKAILMNVFSVLAAYGVTVWAFQDAHLAGALDFTPVGNIDSIVPVFLFCVLFGISTDYEVFLLSRVQEEYLATGRNEESVAIGLQVTGRIITSAAAVMIVVFGAFAFARLVLIKEVGLGLAVAVLVDATLIRALLVPATMRLLGRWNWWMPVRGFTRVPEIEPEARRGKNPAAQ